MALWWMQTLTAAFLAACFLQSGLDKVVDREGNLRWLTEHFSKSVLADLVVPLLNVITVLELAAGIFSALGAVVLLFGGGSGVALIGAMLATLALFCLFVGQRLAKDYAGAAVLVSYFLLGLAALHLFR